MLSSKKRVMTMNKEPDEGTTLIGIVAEDGVVLATDKQTTSGTIKKKGKKVYEIHPNGVIATSGLSADGQKLADIAERRVSKYRFERGREMTAGRALETVNSIQSDESIFLFVLPIFAGYENGNAYLADFDILGSMTQADDFMTAGSGSMIATGVLESEYHDGVSVGEAEEIAVKGIQRTAKNGIFTGVGIDVAVVDESGVEMKNRSEDL